MSRCHRCGVDLAGGAVGHVFEYRLYADPEGEVDLGDDASLERALAEAVARDARSLEEEVVREGKALLCPRCRVHLAAFLDDLSRPADDPGEGPGPVH